MFRTKILLLLPTLALILLLVGATAGALMQLYRVTLLGYTHSASNYTLATLASLGVLAGLQAALRLLRSQPVRPALVRLPVLLAVTASMLVGYYILRDGLSYGFTARGCFTNLEMWLGVTRENSLVRWGEQVAGSVLFFGAPAVGFLATTRRQAKLAA